jgi:alpha-beta hydrolase superfamily lysophospholipase
LPYTASATHESIGHAQTLLAAQVRALARMTGERVRIVAVSEGAMVARSYLQAFPRAPVRDLLLLSPLTEPGRAYYPERGHNGFGWAGGWSSRALASLVSNVAGIGLSPDMPFLRSVVDHAPALQRGLLCPAPQAPVTVYLPVASVALAGRVSANVPIRVIPGFHGDGVRLAEQVAAGLHERTTGSPLWRVVNRALRGSAAAWVTPRLPVGANPDWQRPRTDRTGCPVTGWPTPSR